MVGAAGSEVLSDIITTCNQVGLMVGSVIPFQIYGGWTNNITGFMNLIRNVPANMKNDSISFICLDNEGVFTASRHSDCAMTKYNVTQATRDVFGMKPMSTPDLLMDNYSIYGNDQIYVASPLNGLFGCDGVASIDWLYHDDKSNHTLSRWFETNEQLIDGILNIPNASAISNLSITCQAMDSTQWLGMCEESSSSNSAHVSIVLTMLLMSMSMLFVNGLFV